MQFDLFTSKFSSSDVSSSSSGGIKLEHFSSSPISYVKRALEMVMLLLGLISRDEGVWRRVFGPLTARLDDNFRDSMFRWDFDFVHTWVSEMLHKLSCAILNPSLEDANAATIRRCSVWKHQLMPFGWLRGQNRAPRFRLMFRLPSSENSQKGTRAKCFLRLHLRHPPFLVCALRMPAGCYSCLQILARLCASSSLRTSRSPYLQRIR